MLYYLLFIFFITSCYNSNFKTKQIIIQKRHDPIKEAYKAYALASFYVMDGDMLKAKKWLSVAIKNDPDSVYLHKKMVMILEKLRNWKEAIYHAKRCLELDPKNPEYRLLLADLYRITKKYELAIREYEEFLKEKPKNKRARIILIELLIRKNRLNSALRNLNFLIKNFPDLGIGYYWRARINMEFGRYKEAERDLITVISMRRAFEPALLDLCSLYQMTGRYDKAIDVCRKILSIYPDDLAALERLLILYVKTGRKKDLEVELKKLREHTFPGSPEREVLAAVYLEQGRVDEAIKELLEILKNRPEDYRILYLLGIAYQKKGDVESAIEHFRRIPSDSGYYVSARIRVAQLLREKKQYDLAIKELESALKKRKEKEFYLVLSFIYEEKKDYESALKAVLEALEYNPEDIELLFQKGVILDKMGKKDECIKVMKYILKLDPDNADALNYIGYTYAEQGINLDLALELLKKAVKIKPNSGYIIDSLGWVYFQKGEYEKAIYYLEKAVRLTPDDPVITEHLGDAYMKKGLYEKALKTYKKALNLDPEDRDKIKKKIERIEKILKK